ncbi:MAG: hypothetical protein JST51_12150 [Armatimonadetes bacterium]|nr:hypothetical protein [Armatimonadota bacterium]
MISPSRKLSRIGGTTLVEVLVVIVVFLVGILAIAQIFPGGIRILNRARDNSVAVGLGRSALESLKARPDLVPEAILPIQFQLISGVYTPVVDSNISNTEYSPITTGIDSTGIVQGTDRAWQLQSGPNVFRRVIGETHRLSAPEWLTPGTPTANDYFGCLAMLELGPPDFTNGAPLPGQLLIYGRDMYRRAVHETTDYEGLRDYEFAVGNEDTNLVEIAFPASATVSGNFRVSLTATINSGGNVFTRTLTSQIVTIGTSTTGYVVVPVASIPGVLGGGENLVNVEVNSIKIARLYREITTASAWDPNEIFTYKVINPLIGEVLFNPGLYNKYEERAGATRQPYVARIDYDVRDWRILHEDFRVSSSSPAGLPKVLKLAVPSIRTNSVNGPDGKSAPDHDSIAVPPPTPNQGMEDICFVNNTQVPGANTKDADNVLIIDVETGGQLLESYNGSPTMKIDKTNGYVTLFDIDNDDTNGLTQAIATAGGTVMTNVTGRVLRIFYMGREEWAVQIARNPSHYDFSYNIPGAAQYYVGGSSALGGLPTRIYFPPMDVNRKVSIGKVRYYNGATAETLEGAEFMIKYRSGDGMAQALPSIDLNDRVAATNIAQDTSSPESMAYAVTDVKGVSVLAKVFYNINSFALGTDPVVNLNTGFGNWAKEWSVTTKETYLHRGDAIQ